MSTGALPSRGLVFQLVCRFHRYWAYRSKSTVQPKIEFCLQDGACSVCFLLQPNPSPADLPNRGIKLGSLALQADSSPAELQGKLIYICVPSWWHMHHSAKMESDKEDSRGLVVPVDRHLLSPFDLSWILLVGGGLLVSYSLLGHDIPL